VAETPPAPSLSAAEALAATPFLAGLDPVEVARLVPDLEERQCEAGEAVLRQGEPGDGLYLVRTGRAEVAVATANGAHAVRTVEAGGYFGEGALLRDAPRSATVVARTPLTVWKLPRERFEALVERHPHLPRQVAAELAHRLAEAVQQVSASREQVALAARVAYGSLEPTVQALLRRLAVLAEFDRDLARALLGPAWADAAFERVLEEAVFLQPAERDGWFGFTQESVRAFLLHQLRAELGGRGLAGLQRRGADLLLAREHDDPEPALDLLLAAGEWRRLGRLLEERGEALARREPGRAEAYLRALPDKQLWRRARLVCLLAGCCAAQGKLEQAIEAYREAERRDPAARDGTVALAYHRHLAELHERIGNDDDLLACRRRLEELEAYAPGADGRAEAGGGADANAQLQTDVPRLVERDERPGADAGEPSEPGPVGRLLAERRLSPRWLLAVGVLGLAALGFVLPPPAGLTPAGLRVLATVAALVALSFLDVLPDYLLGLLMIAAWVVSGTLPAAVAANGFAGPTFFLMLASMAIGAAIERSGLLYRGAIEIVRRLPPSHRARCLALAGLGMLFAPGMPSPNARLLLASPLARDIADALREPPRSGGAAGLALATFVGFGLMGSLFLTGNPMCLIIFGVFPPEVQARMSWGGWFLAALPTHLVLFGLTMAFVLWRYRPDDERGLPLDTLALQRRVLGRLTRDEIAALGVLGLLLAGFSTQSVHGLDPAWIAVAALALLFLLGSLDDGTFQQGVNLSFLVYVGVIMGFGQVFAHAELDRWLGATFSGLAGLTGGSPTLFILAAAAVSAVLSLILRPGPISLLLVLALSPTAATIGVSPWVVAITTLLATNLWLYPQQNVLYLTAYHGAGEQAFSHAQARPLAFAYTAFVFVALLASVPYWRLIGLIA
jgi:di/tricarboxylate transporter/CRP-like cAMP-binding protein